VRELARAAGDTIMAVYRTNFDAERKDDGSPVTEADKAAEAAIVPGLRALTPDIPVISEEEFLKRNNEFTVNIGLIEDNVPVLGVLYAPALDLMYAGAGAGSATLTEGGSTERPISCRLPPADGLGVLVSRSHSIGGKVDEYLAEETIRERIPQGSALKFGRLAEGMADIYPRFGPTCEWDTAAGHAIVLAAGGSLTKIDGTHFDYGKKDFLNPGFVACGRR
jgi:3'(2'), 5'-bisphosphate nucleotidase